MVKASYKSASKKVEEGLITQTELDNMVAIGLVSSPRSNTPRRVLKVNHNGSSIDIIPTLYFKGAKKGGLTTPSTEMTELRKEVHEVIIKYTQSA
tara:strand:+ start:236 stop:520 length:285 start_codon:yes stop_codon:yes gene_type:complete